MHAPSPAVMRSLVVTLQHQVVTINVVPAVPYNAPVGVGQKQPILVDLLGQACILRSLSRKIASASPACRTSLAVISPPGSSRMRGKMPRAADT